MKRQAAPRQVRRLAEIPLQEVTGPRVWVSWCRRGQRLGERGRLGQTRCSLTARDQGNKVGGKLRGRKREESHHAFSQP